MIEILQVIMDKKLKQHTPKYYCFLNATRHVLIFNNILRYPFISFFPFSTVCATLINI